MRRRDFVFALPAVAATALVAPATRADDWPSKSIRLVVTQGAGSGSDIVGRLLATKLGERLKQSVVVENRTGGGGIIGHQSVLDAPADGYTLLLSTTAPLVVVPAMNRNAKYRLRDFTAVASAIRSPYMVLVAQRPDGPASLPDLARRLAASDASYSSSGTGTLTHLATEMYLQEAKLKAVHVPYKGSGQSLADLAGGQVLFSIDSPAAAGGLIRSGKLRALAVTSAARLAGYPDVPTMAELGYPGLTITTMGGLFGPPRMPAPVVERISREMAAVMTSPEVTAHFAKLETEALNLPLDAFRAQMLKDAPAWEQVVARLGIVVE